MSQNFIVVGMKGREDREKDYGFAAEMGDAGAAAADDDIDFDTVWTVVDVRYQDGVPVPYWLLLSLSFSISLRFSSAPSFFFMSIALSLFSQVLSLFRRLLSLSPSASHLTYIRLSALLFAALRTSPRLFLKTSFSYSVWRFLRRFLFVSIAVPLLSLLSLPLSLLSSYLCLLTPPPLSLSPSRISPNLSICSLQGFSEQQKAQLGDNTALIATREQEITNIVSSINELSTIFKDLAALVVDQVC